jgi:hypothetical protein
MILRRKIQMAKIIGNTTATPNPRPDWLQSDESKADYIKNKPKLIKYKTELLKAGNSQVKVDLPVDAVIAGVEVRDASGALVMVDSVVTKGSETTVSVVGDGDYRITVTEEAIQILLNQEVSVSDIIGYVGCDETISHSDGGVEQSASYIDIPTPDENRVIAVHVPEDVYKEYPDFGTQEGDTYELIYYFMSDYSFIENIVKITYPSVSIAISEPINEDLEITILYQE